MSQGAQFDALPDMREEDGEGNCHQDEEGYYAEHGGTRVLEPNGL